MTRIARVSDNLPKPAGPYSHIVEANGFVFTAGFGPQDPATGEIPSGVAEQTAATLRNLEIALSLAGLTLADVVKTTVHLQDLGDFSAFNEVYARSFTESFPVRTTVGSTLNGILVEIDAVAAMPGS